MRIVTVKGFKKTGKTTTCVELIRELRRRGWSVASIKTTHFPGFTMDTPGTDSDRHAKAGASSVLVMGNDETDIIFHRQVDLSRLVRLFEEDFLVCEGDPGLGSANIVTGKSLSDLRARRDDRTIGFAGIISAERTEYDGLPVIDASREAAALADLVEKACPARDEAGEKRGEGSGDRGFGETIGRETDGVETGDGRKDGCESSGGRDRGERIRNTEGRDTEPIDTEHGETEESETTDMKKAGEKDLVLKFNGEDVPMVPFVESILKETVLGLVKSLKGYEEGMDVTIELKESEEK